MRRQLFLLAAGLTLLAQAPLRAQWPEIHTESESGQFGWSVSIEKDMALVGAPNDGSGSAFVYERIGGVWTYVTTLTGDASSGKFGVSVDLSVTASACRALVGASAGDNGVGAAYFYDCSDWSQAQKVLGTDSGFADSFGFSVSIDGDLAVIGAIGNDGNGPTGTNDGAAYVFRLEGGTWKQEAKLAAAVPEGASLLGTSVAISGTRAAVGAPAAGAGSEGAVFIFERVASPGSPTGFVWPEQAQLTASDDDPLDDLGRSVSIYGHLVLAGARGDDSIASNSGAAYVFKKEAAGWVQEAKIKAFDAQQADGFGSAVYQSGSWAAIGASADDDAGPGAGAIYVFDRNGCGTWNNQGKLLAANPSFAGALGRSAQLTIRTESAGSPFNYPKAYLTVLGGASDSAHWFEKEIPAFTRACPPREK